MEGKADVPLFLCVYFRLQKKKE